MQTSHDYSKPIKSLSDLLKDAGKAPWCEEFITTSPTSSPSSRMRIREEDQYYFRMWHHVNPNIVNVLGNTATAATATASV